MDFGVLFLLFLIAVALIFTFLIRFMLGYRKKFLQTNLQLTSKDAWESIGVRARHLGLDQRQLLYGIYQDETSTAASMIVRASTDEVLGKAIYPLAKRTRTIMVNEQNYLVTRLLTWNSQIILQKPGEEKIIARAIQTGWFGKHRIDIPEYGSLQSSRVSLDFKASYQYSTQGKIVGLADHTFGGHPKGRIAILPEEIPLPVRLFILSKI